MKLLFKNKRYILPIFLTTLMVLGTHILGYADENNAPVFTERGRATRSIAENTPAGVNIGAPVAATDADGDTLTYTKGWIDGMAFSLDSSTGQIRTKAPLDYETKNLYSFAIFADDGNGGRRAISVTVNVTDVDETSGNNAPIFKDGSSTTRSIAENTASGANIGSAVAATDADDDTLTYTLGGTDAASFSIVRTSGQLQTKDALNYETKSSYSVTVSASDTNGGSDSISVTINVTNVNEAPSFATNTATRAIAENTASGQNVGSAVTATDVDTGDTLTYTLGGADKASFRIVRTSGQLQTKAALNYESKTSYAVTVTATDGGNLSDTIPVTINVTNVNEAPSFASSTATLSIAENTASGQNIGAAVAATDVDGNTLAYTLGGTDASSFSIVSTTGQLQTSAALDRETKASYSVTVTASDGSLSDTTTVTISVTDVNEAPSFASSTATRSIAENTASGQNIGTAVAATDIDGDTLAYTLGGTDASSFSIVSTSGQLQTNAALDRETKASYSVTVTATDGGNLSDTTTVTINVTNVNEAPTFASSTATRSVAENTATNQNIGAAFTATDVDSATITYSIPTTGDAAAFSIVSNTGQLKTKNALNYESKNAYTVVVTASDGTLTDTITVTISVTNVNEAPAFATGATISNISATKGTAITSVTLPAATDVDANTTLTYTVTPALPAGLTFTASTRILSGTPTAVSASTTYTYTASDNNLSATLTFTIQVSAPANNPPTFTDGSSTTRSVAENTGSGVNIGSAVAATDADTGNTLAYTLSGTGASSFSIVGTSGQLQTSTALNYESKSSYAVSVSVSDGNGGSDSIAVTISVTNVNEKPTFSTSGRVTLSVAENTAANTNIGAPFQATDPDSRDTLTYSLQRADKTSFRIDANTGQLKTRAALDYETKNAYSNLAVRATDSQGLVNSVLVTVNVTNANEAPAFSAGATISNISATNGTAITSVTLPEATDPDANTTLTYTVTPTLPAGLTFTPSTRVLSGTPTAVSASATYTYTASDSTLSATLTFKIQVSAAPNNAPVFTDGTETTRAIAENTASGQDIGTAVAATDTDNDTLTYTLGGDDAASFSIVSTTGQLQTSTALDRETKSSYSVTITANDGNTTNNTDTIDVTISVTNVNEAPSFASSTATRSIAENTASGQNIGTAVAATDVDHTSLAYTLGGTDASSFSIVSTSGQLQTSAALDRETKASYSVTVTATDGGNLSDTITVTISVTDVNDAPVFTDGDSTTRAIAENSVANTNIGTIVTATDQDKKPDPVNPGQFIAKDTITYSIPTTGDAAAFSIDSNTGQLKTKNALNYEDKNSYTVVVTASDGSLTDTISVTITVTNVNEAPAFATETTISDISATKGTAITSVTLPEATDVDANTTLTYTLTPALPAGLTFTPSTRLLSGTPTAVSDSATYTYTASDSTLSATLTFSIQVSAAPNNAPVFTDGSSTTRAIAENTASGQDIGTAVAATDSDNDTLTYTLGGTDAASFSIVSNTGQLQTSAALDRETKSSYSVTITADDGNTTNNTDSIDVTISVTNVNEAPSFNIFGRVTLSVEENTAANTNIGTPFQATDPDSGDTLTYSLQRGDKDAFRIDANTGQLKTHAALDYATKHAYSNLAVRATDSGGLVSSVLVTVNVTNVNDNPVFTEGSSTTRTIEENSGPGINVGSAITATDADTGDTLTYTLLSNPLEGGTIDAVAFRIDANTGQLQTVNAKYNYETYPSYSVNVSVSDGNGGSARISVTINLTDDPDEITPVEERTPHVRDAIVAAVPSINDPRRVTPAHLRRIKRLELKQVEGSSIDPPKLGDFSGLTSLTHLFLEYNNISDLSPLSGLTNLKYLTLLRNEVSDISALSGLTKLEGLTLRANNISDISPLSGLTKLRWLSLGDNNISDISALSGLTSLTSLLLADYYDVYIDENNENNISDISVLSGLTSLTYLSLENFPGNLSPLSSLTNLTRLELHGNNISNLSPLSSLTNLTRLELHGNNISDISVLSGLTSLTHLFLTNNPFSDISSLSSLTNLEYLVLTYNNISDISPLSSLTTNLRTYLVLRHNNISDISPLSSLTNLEFLVLMDNPVSDISPLSSLTTNLKYLNLRNNNISDVSSLSSLTSLTKLGLAGNPIPLSQYATIRTLIRQYDIELDNEPPVFTEGDSTTRTVPENTAAGTNIGTAIAATDTEGDTLTYSLGGTDADAFSIVSTSGQLQTKASLDFETKSSYTVTVDVSGDPSDTEVVIGDVGLGSRIYSKGLDRITVTITVTDVGGAAPSVETPPSPVLPKTTELLTNFPNPFNPETWIPYQLAKPAEVTLTIYDIRGRIVRTLRLGHQFAGFYQNRSKAAHWDGRNYLGEKVATGIYFYTLKAGDYMSTRKLLIRK